MAAFSYITMAGGIKAPSFSRSLAMERSTGSLLSDIFISFLVLSDLIAEAAQAEERLQTAASWDPACAGITAEDLDAYHTARVAAEELSRMRGASAADCALVLTAQFILDCLRLETSQGRAAARLTIADSQAIFSPLKARGAERTAAVMISMAMRRLAYLLAVTDAEAETEALTDADQEVQAF